MAVLQELAVALPRNERVCTISRSLGNVFFMAERTPACLLQ